MLTENSICIICLEILEWNPFCQRLSGKPFFWPGGRGQSWLGSLPSLASPPEYSTDEDSLTADNNLRKKLLQELSSGTSLVIFQGPLEYLHHWAVETEMGWQCSLAVWHGKDGGGGRRSCSGTRLEIVLWVPLPKYVSLPSLKTQRMEQMLDKWKFVNQMLVK